MSNRSEILNIVASTQKVMANKRIEGLLMSTSSSAPCTPQGDTCGNPDQQIGNNKSSLPSSLTIPRPTLTTILGARDNRAEFFDTWSRKIDQFVRDQKERELHLPTELNSNDRRVLHSLSDKYNLSHTSVGKGPERHLVLRKDAIFYKAAQASGGSALVDTRGISQLKFKKEDSKGSKYHLRRAVHAGVDEDGRQEDGAEEAVISAITDNTHIVDGQDGVVLTGKTRYADAQAVKAHRQLKNANNQYSYAVDRPTHLPPSSFMVSGSPHPNNHHPHGGDIRGDMTEMDGPWAQAIQTEMATSTSENHHQSLTRGDGVGPSHNDPKGPSYVTTSEIVCYWEQCTSCGTSSELDYDKAEWEAVGSCPKCQRKCVWRLLEKRKHIVVVPVVPSSTAVSRVEPESIEREDDVGDEDSNRVAGHKRSRDDDGSMGVNRKVHAHHGAHSLAHHVSGGPETGPHDGVKDDSNNNNDDDDVMELEIDDAVLNASCNDMKEGDIEWIRSFVEHPTFDKNPAIIGRHLMYCMEFRDVPTRSPLSSSSGDTKKRIFIKLRESQTEGNINILVTQLIQEVIDKVFCRGVEDVFVAFPNSSVYGEAAEALVHGPCEGDVSDGVLGEMKRHHGSKHLIFSRTLEGIL